MSSVGVEILVLILLMLLNGVFSMSEIAVVAARKSRLHESAEKGSRGAHAALELAKDPNQFFSTVQVGITLIGIVAGAFGGRLLAGDCDHREIGIGSVLLPDLFFETGHFEAAGWAPGGPEVDEEDLALQRFTVEWMT